MSFSPQALDLNEAFALLDGFDLVIPACDYESSSSSCCTTAASSSSSNSSPSGSSGHESLTDSDDALLSLLSDASGPCELAFAWDAGRHSLQDVHQEELPSPPTVTQQHRPLANKKVKKVKTATAAPSTKSTAAAAALAVIVKRPRKHNRVEILKLREELEELQVQHSSLQMTQKRQRAADIASQRDIMQHSQSNIIAQYSSGPAIVGGGAARSLWLEHAVEQYKALQQSEALNRKLRDAVAQQLKVTRSMQATLHKRVPAQVHALLVHA